MERLLMIDGIIETIFIKSQQIAVQPHPPGILFLIVQVPLPLKTRLEDCIITKPGLIPPQHKEIYFNQYSQF